MVTGCFIPQCWLQQIAEPTGSISDCITQRGMEVGLLSNQLHRKNCDVYHYFLRKKFEHYPSLNVLLVLPIGTSFRFTKWTDNKMNIFQKCMKPNQFKKELLTLRARHSFLLNTWCNFCKDQNIRTQMFINYFCD